MPGYTKRSVAGGYVAPAGTTVRVYSYANAALNVDPIATGPLADDDGASFTIHTADANDNTAPVDADAIITVRRNSDADVTYKGSFKSFSADGTSFTWTNLSPTQNGYELNQEVTSPFSEWYFSYGDAYTFGAADANYGLGDHWYTWEKDGAGAATQGGFFYDGSTDATSGQPMQLKDGNKQWYWNFDGNAPDARKSDNGVACRCYALVGRNDAHLYTTAVVITQDGTVDSITLSLDMSKSMRDALVLTPLSLNNNLILDTDSQTTIADGDSHKFDARLQLRITRDAAGDTFFKTIRKVDGGSLANVNAMLEASLCERSAQNASINNMQYRLLMRHGNGLPDDTGYEVSNIFDTADLATNDFVGATVFSRFVNPDPHLQTEIVGSTVVAGISSIYWRPTLDLSSVFFVDIVASPPNDVTDNENCGERSHPLARRRLNDDGVAIRF